METFKLKDKSLKELTHFPSVKVSVHNCMTKSEKDGELRLARASLPDETHAGIPVQEPSEVCLHLTLSSQSCLGRFSFLHSNHLIFFLCMCGCTGKCAGAYRRWGLSGVPQKLSTSFSKTRFLYFIYLFN